ncbi:hypothetical protein K1T71_014819 [Dendrolimus kikuchii]|nr:hypothetical protein K1T71_014819 [Dendrolimus kikuchii]
MAKCSACGKFLSPTGAATCFLCPLIFHRGCVAIPETAILSKSWACPDCKKKVRKGDNTTTPVKGICGNESPSETVSRSAAGISAPDISPLEEDESEVRAMRREMAEYMSELRREMVQLRTSIAGFGQRLDSIECRLDVLEQKKEIVDSKGTAELENTIAQLKLEINDKDQEALLSDLDIGCLPEEKGENEALLADLNIGCLPEENGENTVHIVTVVASKLGVTIESRDIVYAERIGTARSVAAATDAGRKARRVVVRLARRDLRDELLHAARVRRNLTTADMGFSGPSQRVFINERLTRTNRQLFHRVREECNKMCFYRSVRGICLCRSLSCNSMLIAF